MNTINLKLPIKDTSIRVYDGLLEGAKYGLFLDKLNDINVKRRDTVESDFQDFTQIFLLDNVHLSQEDWVCLGNILQEFVPGFEIIYSDNFFPDRLK